MPNTIAGVNLAAIAEMSLPWLTTCFAPIRGIISDFSSDIAKAGDSVTTRIPTKGVATSLANGYTPTDVTAVAKTITLGSFFGYVAAFTDVERSKSVISLDELFFPPMIECLGDKVFGDLWALVTAANFPTNVVILPAAFDRSDLADIGADLTMVKKAPKQGRTLWSSPAMHAGLVKSLNSAEFPGQSEDKAEGSVPRTAKFDCYETDLAVAGAGNLEAFAFHRSALLMAARGVLADDIVTRIVEVENVVVPGLGLPIQARRWYDPNAGALKISVGLLYGVSVGTGFGERVTSV
jgi:hypothetical protein